MDYHIVYVTINLHCNSFNKSFPNCYLVGKYKFIHISIQNQERGWLYKYLHCTLIISLYNTEISG